MFTLYIMHLILHILDTCCWSLCTAFAMINYPQSEEEKSLAKDRGVQLKRDIAKFEVNIIVPSAWCMQSHWHGTIYICHYDVTCGNIMTAS